MERQHVSLCARLFRSVKRVLTVGGCSSKTCWCQRCRDSPSTLCCWTTSLNTQRVRSQEIDCEITINTAKPANKYVIFKTNILDFRLAGSLDLPSLQRAQACCRGILQAVNEVVRETEHRQRLSQYQRRLDAAPLFKVVK